jgi:hypothetical protein
MIGRFDLTDWEWSIFALLPGGGENVGGFVERQVQT